MDTLTEHFPGSISFHQRGFLGGGQAGYDWQFAGSWLVGVETDIDFSDIHGDGLFAFSQPVEGITDSFDRKLKWFGTLRARLGFLPTPSLLIYGTGGFACGETSAGGTFNLPSNVIFLSLAPNEELVCEGPGACTLGSTSSLTGARVKRRR